MKRKKPLQRHSTLDRHNNWIPKKARQAGIVVSRPHKPRIPKRAFFHKSRPRPKVTPEESRHMTLIRRQGCIACFLDGVLRSANLHHTREGYGCSQRASHWEVIPLCEGHHQGSMLRAPGEPKRIAFHNSECTFRTRYGTEPELLALVWKRAGLDLDDLPTFRGSEPPWWQAWKEGRLSTTADFETRMALTNPYIEEDSDDSF